MDPFLLNSPDLYVLSDRFSGRRIARSGVKLTGKPTGPALAQIEICSLACLVLKRVSLTKHWRLRGLSAQSVGFVHSTRSRAGCKTR